MCNGDVRWRMCVPVDPDDSDVMLSTLVEDHAYLAADVARLTVALQAATEEARHFETDAAVYLQAICSARYELSHPRTARDADRADAGLCEAILQVRDARDARSLPTEDTKR